MARSVIFNLIANEKVSQGVKKAGKALDELNGKVKQTLGEHAKAGAAAGGVAAGGAFVAGLTGMMQLDNARGKLEAQLGLTKDQSQRVGQVAGKLYSSAYGESMDDVQGAITSVIQNMDGMRTASNQALQQTTARAMDVASVMGEEVGPVTNAVAQMMRTGLAKSSQEAFDILTRGAQTGANKAQDLLDTMNEYGTQFRKVGLDGKTAMGLIQQGLQGGARDADIVADAIKEFSIRAVDGSAGTAAGFKAIGLNAKQMAADIGKGGPSASKALDLVLSRLRGIKDPVKQSQAAVALFGTQAEDLGKSLYSLNPSTAVAALGKVSGAADQAGKSLGQTTQARFESFKRTLQQDVQGAMVSTIGWFQRHTTAAKVLAGVAATLTTAWAAYNAVALVMAARTALMTEGTAANLIVTKAAAAATKIWAGVQWLLNAAMSANPIGLIVIAIVALIAGIVLAYKHSETFRNIVNGVWNAIKTGVVTAINFVRDHWKLIVAILLGPLGPAFLIISTFWRQIWGAIQTAWGLIRPVFNAIASFVRGTLSVAFTVFRNLVKIVWIGIQLYIKVAWAIIKSYFTAMKFYIQNVLAPIFKWLWNNIVKPVWNGIKSAISTNWNAIKAIWNALRSYLSGPLSAVFRTFRSHIQTIWNGVRSAINTASNGIKTVFNGLKTAVNAVKSAFKTAVDGISSTWNRLKSAAKGPVNFVIGLYNNGIVKLVNGIAHLAGIGTRLDRVPTFATGGIMPGYAPGRDSLVAAVSPGEAIMRPEWTRAMGPGRIAAMNAIARKRGPNGVRNWMAGGEGMAFARGGIVPGFAGHFDLGGIVGGFLGGLKKFAFDNVEKVAKSTLNKIVGAGVPGGGLFHDVVAGIPKWIGSSIWNWIKDKVGGVGGKGMRAALNWAKTQSGKPYQWGGNGNPSWDCSGFMSAIESVIRGEKPHRRWATSSFNGGTPSGWHRNTKSGFMIGVLDNGNAHASHTAGTLLGVNVESSGSGGVRVGGGARGYNNGMFPWQYGFKADTGALNLAPGWNPPVFNGTGRPELLTTRAAGGVTQNIQVDVHVPPTASKYEIAREIAETLREYKRRGGRNPFERV